MQIAKYNSNGNERLGRIDGERLLPLAADARLFDLFEHSNPGAAIEAASDPAAEPMPLADVQLLAPLDDHEVWAAGVTYIRSKAARMEESEAAADCYDRVYVADRPELFFKALPHRVSGPNQLVRIRQDSDWDVPEPELALVLNTRLEIVGYTIGNDMSSRSIEGDNPLYLPQAKVYTACCGLGPWITLADAMPPRAEIGITMTVRRGGEIVFEGKTGVNQMARTFEDLVSWLARDNEFPTGAMLLTGTGIVPDSDFTLQSGDLVDITIDGIGTLSNPVA